MIKNTALNPTYFTLSIISLLAFIHPKIHSIVSSNVFLMLALISLFISYMKIYRDGLYVISKQEIILAIILPLTINLVFNRTIGGGLIFIFSYFSLILIRKSYITQVQSLIYLLFGLIPLLIWLFKPQFDYFLLYKHEQSIGLETINPNGTAVFILFYLIFLIRVVILNVKFKNKTSFIVLITFIIMFTLLFLLRTGSRTAQLSFISFLLIVSLIKVFNIKNPTKLIYLIMIMFSILPILLVFLYVFDVDLNLASILSYKSLYSGREQIWLSYFTKAITSPVNFLFGFGTNTSKITTYSNMHNSYIQVLSNFGVFPFYVYAKLIYNEIKKKIVKYKKNGSNHVLLILAAMVSVFTHAVFENSLLSIPSTILMLMSIISIESFYKDKTTEG